METTYFPCIMPPVNEQMDDGILDLFS